MLKVKNVTKYYGDFSLRRVYTSSVAVFDQISDRNE